MFLLLVALGRAGEVLGPFTDADGYVCASSMTAVPLAAIQARLDTAAEAIPLSPDILSVTAVPRGACEVATVRSRGFTSDFTWVTLRCAVSDGWTETMISGDGFVSNDARWRLRAAPGGTEVSMGVRPRLDLPVPQSLIDRATGRSVVEAIRRLLAALG